MSKLWLDDVREPPDSDWVWVKTSLAAIKMLRSIIFELVSLDHDLGLDAGSGYEVLVYIEAEAHRNPKFQVPKMIVHSSNPPARKRMLQAIESIERFIRANK
jgi:hypothetical protein